MIREEAEPFQSTFSHVRTPLEGLDKAKDYGYQIAAVSESLYEILRDTFGAVGLNALFKLRPDLFARLDASIWQAWQDGYREGGYRELTKSCEAGQATTGRMLMALLSSPGLNEQDQALVMLGAHAGVDPEDINGLIKRKSVNP